MKTLTRLTLVSLLVLLSAGFVPGQGNDEVNRATMGYMRDGSVFFAQGDFKHAIQPYQKALDLEKKTPTLDKTLWRVLVDNLGMAYGISGDLKNAKATFEYGLSKDPKYAMFHYNMACTYAEMKDMDKTIVYLKQAFDNKETMIKGEHMPDPWTDDSFQRFIHDDRFVQALKELNRD